LRGQFLRGLGGKSGGLGQIQAEGIYFSDIQVSINGIHPMDSRLSAWDSSLYECTVELNCRKDVMISGGSYNSTLSYNSGSGETRPQNMAVRYLIKAQK
jgi:hypothetical protein